MVVTLASCGVKVTKALKLELLLFVCMRFQDLFHSLPGFFLPFPSQYWFTIGRLRVFSLGGWSPIFRQDFTCPALLVVRLVPLPFFSYGAITRYGRTFQNVPFEQQLKRTGWSDFARHYSRNLG